MGRAGGPPERAGEWRGEGEVRRPEEGRGAPAAGKGGGEDGEGEGGGGG